MNNNSTMKKSLAFFAALAFVIILGISAAWADVPKPMGQGYVNDYANILDEDTKETIEQASAELKEKTGGEIVITTVDFLGGEEIEDYAAAMMNDWGIGDKSKQNGFLFVFAKGDKKYYSVWGNGVNSIFEDGKMDQIYTDYGVLNSFQAGEYQTGIQSLFTGVIGAYEKFYNVQISDFKYAANEVVQNPDYNYENYGYDYNTPSVWEVIMGIIVFVIAAAIFIALIVSMSGRRRRRRGGVYMGSPYYGGGWFGGPRRRRRYYGSPPPPMYGPGYYPPNSPPRGGSAPPRGGSAPKKGFSGFGGGGTGGAGAGGSFSGGGNSSSSGGGGKKGGFGGFGGGFSGGGGGFSGFGGGGTGGAGAGGSF